MNEKNLRKNFTNNEECLQQYILLKKFLNTTAKFRPFFEHIILWMLNKNFACGWNDFKDTPLEINTATLSKYLFLLSQNDYIRKISKGVYIITESGKKRLCEIESSRSE